MERRKQYKALPPEQTIGKIRETLAEKLGIELKELFYEQKNGLFFSSRLNIETPYLRSLGIGTNGKGMTKEYSRASAHAELMERIQNGLLFPHRYYASERFTNKLGAEYKKYAGRLERDNLKLKYAFAPDEVFITDKTTISDAVNRYVKSHDNQEIISEISKNGVTMVPFYNVFDNKTEFLPITLIHNNIGSSGMCAGNNGKEAVIQGISEIFERYVMRQIYLNNITPPSIPRELFAENDIYERILLLEQQNNITIDIKDCSCDLGIPAIGVLIMQNDNQKYQFRIGVDPSAVTALERSLTELFQGRSDVLFFDTDIEYQTRLLTDIDLKEKEFKHSFLAGIGRYPISLFRTTPSYQFKGFDSKWAESDDNDLRYIIEIIKQMGFDLYVRDVSFLGFPSYRVYIPGMSELNNIFSNNHFKDTHSKHESLVSFLAAHNINKASEEDIRVLLDYIGKIPESIDTTAISFMNDKDVWKNTNINFITAMLQFRTGEYHNAAESMNKAAKNSQQQEVIKLYKCIRDIIVSSINKQIEVMDAIQRIYNEKTFRLARQLLFSDNWTDHFNFTTCFDCDRCKISDNCKYFDYLRLVKAVESEYERSIPEQQMLSKIFKNSL